MNKKNTVSLFIIIIILTIVSFLGCKTYSAYNEAKIKRLALKRKKVAWDFLSRSLEKSVFGFKGEVSIVVKDLDTNWEIAFNKDVLLPSASLVKIPIMLSCYYAAQEGKISLTDTVSLSNSVKVPGSKVLGEAPAGSVFSIQDLLEPMITESDNTAANVLIETVGFDALNSYFKKIGLKNTNLARKMLDFKERSEGVENYTTAREMAYLLEALYRRNFLNKNVSDKCLQLLGQQKVNDRIPRGLPKGTPVAHKTGLERHVCHDVGIVYTEKGAFLICVLVRHSDKFAQPAKKFISRLSSLAYNYYQSLN
jgi:beta-lactamase class A